MKKHKFTWIDGLVLVVLVLLVIGTVLKFTVKDNSSVTQESVEFQCQLEINGVQEFVADALAVGDTVYVKLGKGAIGTICDISVEPAKDRYITTDGQVIVADVEGTFDITLTVTGEGTPVGDTYKVGTNTLYLNQYTSYFTRYLAFSATTVSIG